jgi:hypothetical protein
MHAIEDSNLFGHRIEFFARNMTDKESDSLASILESSGARRPSMSGPYHGPSTLVLNTLIEAGVGPQKMRLASYG